MTMAIDDDAMADVASEAAIPQVFSRKKIGNWQWNKNPDQDSMIFRCHLANFFI